MNRPTDLKPGTETAAWVLDTITSYPDLHYQHSWEETGAACGTTRCVGGWALYAHGMEVYELEPTATNTERASGLLGLDLDEGDRLFYRTTDEQAVEALRYLAKGEQIDWKKVDSREIRELPEGFLY